MKSGIIFAILAISMVSAFPLADEAFAQTPRTLGDIVKSAETTRVVVGTDSNAISITSVKMTFTAPVFDIELDDFTVGSKSINAITASDDTTAVTPDGDPISVIILQLSNDNAFQSGDRPFVAFNVSGDGIKTTLSNDSIVTYNSGSVRADDKIPPNVASINLSGTDDSSTGGEFGGTGDAAAPVHDASITDQRELTIKYDERVIATLDDYAGLYVGKIAASDTFDDLNYTTAASFEPRNVTAVHGSGTDTHTLSFSGPLVNDTDIYGKIRLGSGIKDMNNNVLLSNTTPSVAVPLPSLTGSATKDIVLYDKQAPKLISHKITTSDQITLEWSEDIPEDNLAGKFPLIKTNGVDRTIATDGINEDPEDADPPAGIYTITLDTLDSSQGPDAAGRITIEKIKDNLGNEAVRHVNLILFDGQPPGAAMIDHDDVPSTDAIANLRITGPNEITFVSTEAISVKDDTFYNLMVDHDGDNDLDSDGLPTNPTGDDTFTALQEDRNITAIRVSNTTVTIEFDGEPVENDAIATISIKDSLTDIAGNTHEYITDDVTTTDIPAKQLVRDGQAPKLISAKLTSPTEVELTFSENMGDPATTSFELINIAQLTPTTNIPIDISNVSLGTPNSIITLTLETTGTVDLDDRGTVRILDTLLDANFNKFSPRATSIDPAQRPTVESASFTGPNELTIAFSKAIDVSTATGTEADFVNLKISGEAGNKTRDIYSVERADTNAGISDNETADDIAVIKFTCSADDECTDSVSTSATGQIDIKGTITTNGSTSELFTAKTQTITDGQTPKLLEIADPSDTSDSPAMIQIVKITGPNTIAAEFTETVTPTMGAFRSLMIGEEADSREITNIAPRSGKIFTLTFAGSGVASDASGTIMIADTITDMITDQSGNKYENTNSPITARDGQKPELESISITGPNEVTAEFTEPITRAITGGATYNPFISFYVNGDLRSLSPDFPTTPSASLELNFPGSAVPVDATGRVTITADLVDAAGNPLDRLVDREIISGQIPYVKSAMIVAFDQIEIVFSEPVDASKEYFTNLILNGESKEIISAVLDSEEKMIELLLDTKIDEIPTDAIATINIEGVSDKDTGENPPNAIIPQVDYPVADGQKPILDSISITDENQVTIVFSEAVEAKRGDFGKIVSIDNVDRAITDFEPSGDRTFLITFDGNPAEPNAEGTIPITADVIKDSKDNTFKPSDVPAMITDGQKPELLRAEFGEGRFIAVVYSEIVTGDSSSYSNLRFDSGDIRSISASRSGMEHGINYTGSPAQPEQTATMDVNRIKDVAENDLGNMTVMVNAHKSPTVKSASFTQGNEITIKFSEPVMADSSHFTALSLRGETENREINVDTFKGSGTDTIVIEFEGSPVAAGTVGTIDILGADSPTTMPTNANVVKDLMDKPLTTIVGQNIIALQASGISSAHVTGPNQVTLEFPVRVQADASSFTNLNIAFSDRTPSNRTITGITGTGTNTIVLEFSGDPVPTDATATIDISRIANVNGATLQDLNQVRISDGQPPTLEVSIISSNENNALALEGDTVTLMFTASEKIALPTVTINENNTSPTENAGYEWSAERIIRETDPRGPVMFTIDFEDTAGNTGTQVTTTTDNSMVSTLECPPGQITNPYDSTCTDPLPNEVKIGLLLSDASSWEAEGLETIESSKKAVTDFNMWLAGEGREWRLTAPYMDTELEPAIALGLVQDLKAEDVDVIVGVPTSASVTGIRDYINNNGMVLISCCSTAPQLAIADNVFRMVPDDSRQAPLLTQLIIQSGESEIVIVYRDDAWGQGYNTALVESFETDGTVITSIPYVAESSYTNADFTTIVTQISDALPDRDDLTTNVGVVFLGFAESVNIMSVASEDDVLPTLRWFGSGDSANDQALLDDDTARQFAIDTDFTVVSFTEDSTDTTDVVRTHIMDTLDRSPSVYAYSAYDAVWVAGLAIDRAQSTDGTDVLEHVRTVAESRTGAIGPNELNDYGDLAQANFNIWTIEGEAWVNKGHITSSSITGTVFTDMNNNGTQDEGEPGYPDYEMIMLDGNRVERTITDENGMYSFENVRSAPVETLVQTLFFPPGHTVQDDATSWFTRVMPEAGGTSVFNVGFYPVPDNELVTLNLTLYHDVNRNKMQDSGESFIPNVQVGVYTFTIGPDRTSPTNANGNVMHKFVPADWAIWDATINGLATTRVLDGEATDNLVIDDPEPGSTYNLTIGLAQIP